jgi:hypothetical protein
LEEIRRTLRRREDAIIAGPIGAGKTHLAIAPGLEASRRLRSREIHLAGGAARNSRVFGVDGVLRRHRIRDHPMAPRSPWQNGQVERLIGSIRRESLDQLVGGLHHQYVRV